MPAIRPVNPAISFVRSLRSANPRANRVWIAIVFIALGIMMWGAGESAAAQSAKRPDFVAARSALHRGNGATNIGAAGVASQAAMPVFSAPEGSYGSAQTVTISDATPGASIYYTTDGSYPIPAYAKQYSAPITVSTSEIVVAVATAPGYANSRFGVARYLIGSSNSSFVYTVAGTQAWGYSGDGGPATFAQLSNPSGIAVDASGNVYIVDSQNYVVRKVAAGTGIITTFAGTGVSAHTGDNGPAAAAGLWDPYAIAVDTAGNVYIAENGDHVVRKVDVNGAISTYAGGGTGAVGSATGATLYSLSGLACDQLGNLYIAEEFDVLKVTTATGAITNLAGLTGSNFFQFGYVAAIAVDTNQNVYVIDYSYNVVRRIDRAGTVTVIAGSLTGAHGGDGGPATNVSLNSPQGLAMDGAGNLYIADSSGYEIRKVNLQTGIISAYAGSLYTLFSDGGDGDPATSVAVNFPQNIASDALGNVYYSDGSRVRKITAPAAPPSRATAAPVFSVPEGTYSTTQTLTISDATPGAEIFVSIGGALPSTSGEGFHGPIELTGSTVIQAVAVAPGYLPSSISKSIYAITEIPAALITTVAGSSTYGYSGSGGPATNARFRLPQAVTVDGNGNLYIADQQNSVVWMVSSASGNIAVVAGNATEGYSGDGGQATAAQLTWPSGVAVDKSGNLFIADALNSRIRKVAAGTGIITTIAGPGQVSFLGDGGLATGAYLNRPTGLQFDAAGDLYVADWYDGRVRKIATSTGIITTVAGVGPKQTNSPGDGGPATSAQIFPVDLGFNKAGDLYIADYAGLVRKVDARTGIITTISGNGMPGPGGDGILAKDARINIQGLAVDAAGNIYFSNRLDWTVKKIDVSSGVLTTVAGNGYYGFGGDGSAATIASLESPAGLAFDSGGNLYIADAGNYDVRKVTATVPTTAPVISLAAGSYTGPQTVTITDGATSAAIYFTTDGSMPTTGSSVYSGPITVSATETLQAIAIASGFSVSGVAKAAYIITPATPTIAWANPAVIFYGTDLSGVLNAKATFNASPVPGTFAYTATLSGGKASAVTAVTILGAGSYTLNATFTPTDTAGYTGATGSVTLGVSTVTPTVSVVSSANPQLLNQPVTFTATVSNPVVTPTGTVTFYNGSTQLGQSTLTNGVAIYTMPMPEATELIQAMYSGDSNFTSASSTAFAQGFSDFGVLPGTGGTSLTVQAGGQATYQIVIAAAGTGVAKLMNPVTLTVNGLPAGATATFSPTTAAAQSASTNVTLTVNTPANAAAAVPGDFPSHRNRLPVALGTVLLIALSWVRKASRTLRSRVAILMLALAGAAALAGIGACGGGGGATTTPPPVTHPQSFTLTVTGTEGVLSHTLSLSLNTY